MSKSINALVFLLVFAFPILMAVVKGAASGIFMLLFMIGIFSIRKVWSDLLSPEKQLFVGFALFAGYAALSISWADDPHTGFRRLEKILRFVFAIPLYCLIRQKAKLVYSAFVSSLAVAGPIILWSAIAVKIDGRSSGAYNSILFGDFAVLISVTALSIGLLSKATLPILRFSLVLSASAALYASLLSMTRGAILVFPIAVLIISFFITIRFKKKQHRLMMALGIFFTCLVLITGLAQNLSFQSRWQYSAVEVQRILQGDFNGAIGTRLLNWKAATEHMKKSPLYGSGLGDHKIDTLKLIKENQFYQPIKPYAGEAHSLFFEHLGTLGIAGLSLLLWAGFIRPALTLARPSATDKELLALKATGILIITSGLVFGIGQNWLSRNSFTAAYLFFITVILAIYVHELKSAPQQKIR